MVEPGIFEMIHIFRVHDNLYFRNVDNGFIRSSKKSTVAEIINEFVEKYKYTYIGPVTKP
jgi:hypothetical protein